MDCPWSNYFLISPISFSSLLWTLEPWIVHISIMREHHKTSPSLWPYFHQPWSHLTILVALIGRATQRWAVWRWAPVSRFPIHFVFMSTSHIFFLLRLIFLLLVCFSLFSFILESWTHAWLKLEKSENMNALCHFLPWWLAIASPVIAVTELQKEETHSESVSLQIFLWTV